MQSRNARIRHANGRREVIVGQIHGPGGTPPIILCVNDKRGGALELFKQGPRQGDLLTGLKPDIKFTYRIESPGKGRLMVFACLGDVHELPTTPQFDFPYSAFTDISGLYFKSGPTTRPRCMRAPQVLPSSASSAATWSSWFRVRSGNR